MDNKGLTPLSILALIDNKGLTLLLILALMDNKGLTPLLVLALMYNKMLSNSWFTIYSDWKVFPVRYRLSKQQDLVF